MSVVPSSTQLREDVDLAGHLAVRARVFLDIWRLYDGAPTRGKYLETMSRFSEFYRFEPHAHFVAMVMYLSQLFEPRNDTLNLPTLLKQARSAGLSDSVFEEGKLILESMKPLASKVKILRSNLFAHRSAKLSYSEVFNLAKVTPDQLRELSDAALRFANTLGRNFGVRGKIIHALSPTHAERVLKVLADSNADT